MSRGIAALALASLAIGAGCGGDSADESNGVESKPAAEILAESARALGRVKTFHIDATEASSARIKADIGLPKELSLSLKDKASSASMIVANGSFYMKGNPAWWREVDAGPDSEEIAGRWFKVPLALAEELTQYLNPKTLGRCLVKDHGTLAKGGTATIFGQRAVVLIDKGDKPGTAPGKLYVAATGEPLPLRLVTTGKQRPGGPKRPECGDTGTPAEPGDVATFSGYNEPLDISAPPGALDLGTAGSPS